MVSTDLVYRKKRQVTPAGVATWRQDVYREATERMSVQRCELLDENACLYSTSIEQAF